jgi:peptide-methionine (R)-S-oxide reductase
MTAPGLETMTTTAPVFAKSLLVRGVGPRQRSTSGSWARMGAFAAWCVLFLVSVSVFNNNNVESFSLVATGPPACRTSTCTSATKSGRQINMMGVTSTNKLFATSTKDEEHFVHAKAKEANGDGGRTGNTGMVDRKQFASMLASASIAGIAFATGSEAAQAFGGGKSRTQGYKVQKSDDEWQQQLSRMQYYILRDGGTERPGSSILESEKRAGTFVCAACETPLFESAQKFKSGTGWPSFAATVTNNVEVEDVNVVQKSLAGAEVRCATCGGHLGDVFQDGFLFPGTPAFLTGKRYCIDGGALAFLPADGKAGDAVMGDLPPNNSVGGSRMPPTL